MDTSEYQRRRFVPRTLAHMPSLKKWLRNKLPWSTPTRSRFNQGPLPFLPVERPSILTPSPSQEALVSSMDSYGYFQLLPYEIRRQILVEALGGRTLHVNLLSYNYPIFNKKGKYVTTRPDENERWEWFSCVCHQPNLWPEGAPRRNFEGQGIKNPRSLPCAVGCFIFMRNHGKCENRIDGAPLNCHIGVMGWLLACRQAYAEGIDVVFATNTIHMKDYDLLRNLPRILLPQRLHSIESLEIPWTFRSSLITVPYDAGSLRPLWKDPTTEDSVLHEMCGMVPKLFPRLRQLDINLLCNIDEPNPPLTEDSGGIERVILGPIEDMIRVLGLGPEVCLVIQQGAFHSLCDKQRYSPTKVKMEWYDPYITRFWKELDASNGLGYWICCVYPDGDRFGMTVLENNRRVDN